MDGLGLDWKDELVHLEERRMKRLVAITIVIGVLGGLSAIVVPCVAQTLSAPANPLNPAGPQNPGIPPSVPSIGVSATASPATTSGITQAPTVGSAAPGPTTSAGRGLPGMPGGPPLNAPMGAGARDATSTYMRPIVIGPLECDLSLDPACL
jgi:hypothetical protein